MRPARRFPIILERLAEGAVTLTTVRLLAPHLTPANVGDLLHAARHTSKREIEALVAGLRPQPPIPSRGLPRPRHKARTRGGHQGPARGVRPRWAEQGRRLG